jgi:transketolase
VGAYDQVLRVSSGAPDDPGRDRFLLSKGHGPAAYYAVLAAKGFIPEALLNVGIREQLMISVAGGLALAGMRPIVHSYASFLVERAFEQVKLDLAHQDAHAVLVSIGASYDAARAGRTHQAPEDVALIDTVPGFSVLVPGTPPRCRDPVAGRCRVGNCGAGRAVPGRDFGGRGVAGAGRAVAPAAQPGCAAR